MPFKDNYFIKFLLCVVHTLQIQKLHLKLKKKLKINGEIVIDVYRKHQNFSLLFNFKTRPETRTRHFFRFLTKKLMKKLHKLVKIYVYLLWPFVQFLILYLTGNIYPGYYVLLIIEEFLT